MPKPRVTGRSTNEPTRRIQQYEESILSPSCAKPVQVGRLSYLSGAVNSSDMGPTIGQPFPGESGEDWELRWKIQRNLRVHTVEQGSSTFTREFLPPFGKGNE